MSEAPPRWRPVLSSGVSDAAYNSLGGRSGPRLGGRSRHVDADGFSVFAEDTIRACFEFKSPAVLVGVFLLTLTELAAGVEVAACFRLGLIIVLPCRGDH